MWFQMNLNEREEREIPRENEDEMKSPIRMNMGGGEINEYPSNTLFNRFIVYQSINQSNETFGWSNSTSFRITNIVSFSSSSCRNDSSFYIQFQSISLHHFQESHPNIPLREEDSMKWFDVQQEDDTLIEHRTQILESLLQPKQSVLHKRNHFEIPSH